MSAARPWWRPVMYSAAVTAAIAALFSPVPALAAPDAPPLSPVAPAVPDAGSRPMPLGSLVLPGQVAPSTTPTTTPSLTGVALSPVLQQIEKGRAEIATLGDQLIQVGQDRDLAQGQRTIAEQRYTTAITAMQDARAAANNVAAESMIEAAGLPPGAYSGLSGLDDLARLQRGGGDTEQAVARQIETTETTVQLALDDQTLADQHYTGLVRQYDTLNTQLGRKQTAQQTLELSHADELNAAEAIENATDTQLGGQYLAGAEAGRGSDPRAIQALTYALAQRGDPYVWSEEGPNEYDCSGLMYAAYHSVGFPLTRVSRDQYWQTRKKVVDRYSLLPGDLLFFSYSNSWRGIHHVAMYAGNGMMVEAPRTGLNVRLVPVRWTRLFQATRIFGSVQGTTEGPVLGDPDPEEPTNTTNPTSPATTPPSSTKPPTTPTKPTTPTRPTTPPTTPPTSPSTPTTPPTTPPTTEPTTPPTTEPTTKAPEPTTEPTTPTETTTAPSQTGGTSATSSSTAAEQTSKATSAAQSSATGSSASSSSAN